MQIKPQAAQPSAAKPAKLQGRILKQGESPQDVARQAGVSMQDLAEANPSLDLDKAGPGVELQVPTPKTGVPQRVMTYGGPPGAPPPEPSPAPAHFGAPPPPGSDPIAAALARNRLSQTTEQTYGASGPDAEQQTRYRKNIDRMVDLAQEGREQVKQEPGFWDSDATQTAAWQSERAFREGELLLRQAKQKLGMGDYEGFREDYQSGYDKLQIGLRAQGKVAESQSGTAENRANWARFVRDSAIETEIALATVYMGGVGSIAGQSTAMTQLAANAPKVYQFVAPLLDSVIVSVPHLLNKAQDLYLSGTPLPEAIGRAFADVGLEGVLNRAIEVGGGKLLKGLVSGGKLVKGAADKLLQKALAQPGVAKFMLKLEESMPAQAFQKLKQELTTKAEAWLSKKASQAADLYEAADNKLQEFLSRRGLKVGGQTLKFKSKEEYDFVVNSLEHSDRIQRLIGKTAKGHDLIGPDSKIVKEIYEGLSSTANIDAMTDKLKQAGAKELKEIFGPKIGETLSEKGIKAVPLEDLRDVRIKLAEAIRSGKLGKLAEDHGGPEVFAQAADATLFAEIARKRHSEGNLHHQIFKAMDRADGVSPGAFLEKLDSSKLRFETGKPVAITEKHLEEACTDLVDAWRDGGRGYKAGKTWGEIKMEINGKKMVPNPDVPGGQIAVHKFSDLQRKYLNEAAEKLFNAEKAGAVHYTAEQRIESRLQSLWVYANRAFWDVGGARY
ncbi:MAG: LysM peptidoglycan-binding domain-containing protein [Acidobacteria bacterium]|nr:LysM peptidoglycan-binding domain-containing protein [Acidobacteriota bacterium]